MHEAMGPLDSVRAWKPKAEDVYATVCLMSCSPLLDIIRRSSNDFLRRRSVHYGSYGWQHASPNWMRHVFLIIIRTAGAGRT